MKTLSNEEKSAMTRYSLLIVIGAIVLMVFLPSHLPPMQATEGESITFYEWSNGRNDMVATTVRVDNYKWSYSTTGRAYISVTGVNGVGDTVGGWMLFVPEALANGVAVEKSPFDSIIPVDQLSVIPIPEITNLMSLDENNQLVFNFRRSGFFEWEGQVYHAFNSTFESQPEAWAIVDGQGNWWDVPYEAVQAEDRLHITVTIADNWLTDWVWEPPTQ
jgi:hypothetical protein